MSEIPGNNQEVRDRRLAVLNALDDHWPEYVMPMQLGEGDTHKRTRDLAALFKAGLVQRKKHGPQRWTYRRNR